METVSDAGVQVQKRQELMAKADAHHLIVTPDALSLLETATSQDADRILSELAAQNLFIVNPIDVETKLQRTKMVPQAVEVNRDGFVPKAKDFSSNYRLLDRLNYSSDTTCEGHVADFVKLFSEKFLFLEGVLRKRGGFSPKPIAQVMTTAVRDVDFIGMIREKWVTKNGHLAFRLEDLDSECIALVLKTNDALMGIATQFIPDEVVGVKGKKGSGGLIMINELIQPDLPLSSAKTISDPLNVAVISDLHVGSKLFLEKELRMFFDLLTGKAGSPKEREAFGRVKYLVIAGDNVDGIGVYPGQINNLSIKDLFEQYRGLEDLLLELPEYIEMFIIPGQHDAVRWADPQPAIPKQYVPRLYECKNVHFLPSPGWIEIEGLKTLLYHGASLHEMYQFVPTLSMNHPERAMIEILKRRSFLMNYGDKQPYAPEKRNYLTITEEPDFYFGGDMHHIGFDTYRGCTVLNSSCFQARTDYEVKLGHIPTPGIIPVIELNSRKIWTKSVAAPESP